MKAGSSPGGAVPPLPTTRSPKRQEDTPGAEPGHRPGVLVAHDHTRRGHVVKERVNVRPADRAIPDLHQQLTRPGLRRRYLLHTESLLAFVDGSLHNHHLIRDTQRPSKADAGMDLAWSPPGASCRRQVSPSGLQPRAGSFILFFSSRVTSAKWVSFSLTCWRWTIRSGPAVRTMASPCRRSIQNRASLARPSRSS